MNLYLEPIPPYDFERVAGTNRVFAPEDGIDLWDGNAYRRLINTSGGCALVAVESVGSLEQPRLRAVVEGSEGSVTEAEVSGAVTRLLSTNVDLRSCQARLSEDLLLGTVARVYRGVRPSRTESLFEALAGGVLEQQIALAVAVRLKNRLAQRFGRSLTVDGAMYHAFPTSAALAASSPVEIRAIGTSGRKAEYIHNVACLVASGQMDLDSLERLDDAGFVAALTALRGIGLWTAEYAALRGLGRYSCVPAGDLALRRAVGAVLGGGQPATETQTREFLGRFGDCRGYAAFCLLRLAFAGPGEEALNSP
ncbi:MAG: hypothetical protein M1401_08985 [Chloroflexi bacterium]|nr:hypothetical protein [Chloroflexota bacterium]